MSVLVRFFYEYPSIAVSLLFAIRWMLLALPFTWRHSPWKSLLVIQLSNVGNFDGDKVRIGAVDISWGYDALHVDWILTMDGCSKWSWKKWTILLSHVNFYRIAKLTVTFPIRRVHLIMLDTLLNNCNYSNGGHILWVSYKLQRNSAKH